MTTIRKVHRKPYRQRGDLKDRLVALTKLICSLRDCDLPQDSKKRMLNHAVWEVTIALGNFSPEFRSKGVLEGVLGTKIEREHVFRRKKIVADILSAREDIATVVERIVHCVVTKDEHAKLKSILESDDGWSRYSKAGISVYRCGGNSPEMKKEP
jgi:hypothetical protein